MVDGQLVLYTRATVSGIKYFLVIHFLFNFSGEKTFSLFKVNEQP